MVCNVNTIVRDSKRFDYYLWFKDLYSNQAFQINGLINNIHNAYTSCTAWRWRFCYSYVVGDKYFYIALKGYGGPLQNNLLCKIETNCTNL